MSILASAYEDRIVIEDIDMSRWLAGDIKRQVEVIGEGPGLDDEGWPVTARAAKILTAQGWTVTGDWDRRWDNSRGQANGTLERDPGCAFVAVERA